MSKAPSRTGRMVLFGLVAASAVILCVRLGIWQLDRLAEKRAYNSAVAARLDAGAEPASAALARDTADARWRRVTGQAVPDYSREVVLAARTRGGSPGVWIVTPVRLLDNIEGPLVALVRGWVYSPNGRTVDLATWREADTLTIDGLVDAFHFTRESAARLPSDTRAFRWLNRDTLADEWGAEVAPMLVFQLGDSIGGYASTGGTVPARFPVPTMSEGPHQSYAFQWFGFATVFVVGFGAVLVSNRRKQREDHDGPPKAWPPDEPSSPMHAAGR